MELVLKSSLYKLALFTGISLLSYQQSFARTYSTCPYPQHEVGVGYGYLSNDQLAISFLNSIGIGILKPIADLDLKNESYSFIGPVSLNYKFFVKEKLSVGASLIYSYTGMKYENQAGATLTNKFHAASVLPRLDFYYVRNPKFALYGAIGAGVMILNSQYESSSELNDTGVTFAYQITPIAMRIGRDFGFVLELGLGSQGLGNAGFSYRHYDRPWSFN